MDEYKEPLDEQEPVRVYTKEETNKKCPMCEGDMEFDPATGGLKCPYCGHEIEIESGAAARETDFDRAEDLANHDWGVNWGSDKSAEINDDCYYVNPGGDNILVAAGITDFDQMVPTEGDNVDDRMKEEENENA